MLKVGYCAHWSEERCENECENECDMNVSFNGVTTREAMGGRHSCMTHWMNFTTDSTFSCCISNRRWRALPPAPRLVSNRNQIHSRMIGKLQLTAQNVREESAVQKSDLWSRLCTVQLG